MMSGILLALPLHMSKKRRRSSKIKFQYTKNRKKDIIRFLVAGISFFAMITVYWNHSVTPLGNLVQGYRGYILQGSHEQKMLDEEGVALIKTWLEENTSPTMNPVTILKQHQFSKNPSNHYDLAIGMVPLDELDEETIRQYAIYQVGNTIYLQVEPLGIDRVLTTTFSIDDLEKALEPYIEGEFRSTTSATP